MPIRKRIPVVLAVSLLLLIGIVLGCMLLLPRLVENLAVSALEEKQVTVRALPIGKIGFQAMELQSGSIEYAGMPLSWKAIDIQYQPLELLSTEVNRVRVDSPVLEMDLNRLLEGGTGMPEISSAGVVDLETPGKPDDMGDEAPSGRESGTAVETGVTAMKTQESVNRLPDVQEAGPDQRNPWDVTPILDEINAFPVSEFEISNGQFKLHGLDDMDFSIGVDGTFWKSEDILTGAANFSGDDLGGSMEIDGMRTSNFLSIRTGLEVESSRLVPILYEVLERNTGYDEHPLVVYPDHISLDLLLETVPGNQLAASGEVGIGKTAALFPEYGAYLQFDSVNLAGSIGSGHGLFSAGVRMGRSRIKDVEIDPFGITSTLDQEGSLTIESESITSRYKDFSVKSAFRGKAQFSGSGSFDSARLEWSIGEIPASGIHVDPFSALVSGGLNALQIELSPVGLRRNGTLWVEQFLLDWDLISRSGSGSLEWYDTLGAHAGSVEASFSSEENYPFLVDLSLKENSGESALRIRLGDGDRGQLLEASGHLPAAWINTVTSWWGDVLPGRFQGQGPGIEASLSGQSLRYFGDLRLEFSECGFESSTGIALEGIGGDVHLEVNILPRTPEIQEMRIRSIRFSEIELKNCWIEWQWFLVHRLQVKRFTADLGQGRVWIEPFSFNPLNPEIRTRLMFSGIEADQLMDLLDEKRFSVEGNFSGSLEVGWKNGDVLLGEGQFRIEPPDTVNRFRFLDPGFVDEHLSNLGSAPDELKERFREALLDEGIRLDQLEVIFRSVEDSDQVMLRFEMSGETKTELLEIPIKGIVINNLISGKDLGELLNMLGSIRMMDVP